MVQDERRRGPEREVRGRDALERVPAEPRVCARDEHAAATRDDASAHARAPRARSSSWPITRPSIGPRTRWYIASANGASARERTESAVDAAAAEADADAAEAASAAATDSNASATSTTRASATSAAKAAPVLASDVERRFLRRQNGRELLSTARRYAASEGVVGTRSVTHRAERRGEDPSGSGSSRHSTNWNGAKEPGRSSSYSKKTTTP